MRVMSMLMLSCTLMMLVGISLYVHQNKYPTVRFVTSNQTTQGNLTTYTVENWPYSAGVEHALRHAQTAHTTAYFRDLAAALLNAPNATAVARQQYICSDAGVSVYPVSFSIPESMFHATVPAKAQNFSHVIPGLLETYK